MFPAYPLICFNAAVSLYLMRGWMEAAYVAKVSPYAASISKLFGRTTLYVILTTSLISVSRIMALWHYYHAPMSVVYQFESLEIPRLLNTTGHIQLPIPNKYGKRERRQPRINLTSVKDFNLKLCIGKEWYRFPGSYLVFTGVEVGWIKSEFDGLLPGRFAENVTSTDSFWFAEGTRAIPSGMNDLNHGEAKHYTDISTCDYLIDLDFPLHPVASSAEPRYSEDETWEKVSCAPFLDAKHSLRLTRTLWLPGTRWQQGNEWGEYCLLRHSERMARKELEMAITQK